MKIPIRTVDGIVYALVDAVDEDLLPYAWHLSGGKAPNGQVNHGKYAATARTVAGKQRTIFLHRVVASRMGLVPDPFTVPPSHGPGQWQYSIDHKNGDKLDNRRSNLRLRSRSQQQTNRNDGLRVTNNSGFRGVSHVSSRGRSGKPWRATISENHQSITLGWFSTAEDADTARLSYEAAPDKVAWLAARTPRATASSGFRGVLALDGRFFASTTEDGMKVALGGYSTAEEAAAARADYLEAPDKAAWLKRTKGAPQSNGSSGFRGVTFLKQVRQRQWQAYATKDGKRVNLGRYDTAKEAADARRAWEEVNAGV
jgi:HNH endonuclease